MMTLTRVLRTESLFVSLSKMKRQAALVSNLSRISDNLNFSIGGIL